MVYSHVLNVYIKTQRDPPTPRPWPMPLPRRPARCPGPRAPTTGLPARAARCQVADEGKEGRAIIFRNKFRKAEGFDSFNSILSQQTVSCRKFIANASAPCLPVFSFFFLFYFFHLAFLHHASFCRHERQRTFPGRPHFSPRQRESQEAENNQIDSPPPPSLFFFRPFFCSAVIEQLQLQLCSMDPTPPLRSAATGVDLNQGRTWPSAVLLPPTPLPCVSLAGSWALPGRSCLASSLASSRVW